MHDASVNEDGGFLLRRVRLSVAGRYHRRRLQLYFQHDFGAAVNNQSSTERRENFGQLREFYADWFLDPNAAFACVSANRKCRSAGENLQSSSNRLPLDRSERDQQWGAGRAGVGVNLYYTPARYRPSGPVAKNKQKLFGNYSAFGLAVYNGQGTNRTERNGTLMKVAMATWPFALDGLGPLFRGQVLEVGGSAMFNRFRPEHTQRVASVRSTIATTGWPFMPFSIRSPSASDRMDDRLGPAYDGLLGAVRSQRLGGGYVR